MTSDPEEHRTASGTEAWLRGPLPDVSLLLTPAAHVLLQAAIDIEHAAAPLTTKEVWSTPGGAPSVGFHLRHLAGSIEDALQTLRSTPDEILAEPREVGRAKLPSTVFGLLFHVAEHTQRHTGQIVTTARIVRGLSSAEESQS